MYFIFCKSTLTPLVYF